MYAKFEIAATMWSEDGGVIEISHTPLALYNYLLNALKYQQMRIYPVEMPLCISLLSFTCICFKPFTIIIIIIITGAMLSR